MHIIIPDDYQDAVQRLACFGMLTDHQVTIYHDTVKDEAVLAERLQTAEALVLIRERTHITDRLIERLPRLKMIAQTGRGTTHIDLRTCTQRGVVVCAGGGSPFATAELTWGLVLAALRRIPQEAARLRAGSWQSTIGTGLHGRILGVWGYGSIGRIVARYGRAFGMQVTAWGRTGSLRRAAEDGFMVAESKQTLLSQADVLCLHVKLNAETVGMLQAEDLAIMKPTALLVNTSRAGLIAPGALETALRLGRPGMAAVDVYEDEPILGAAHPLLTLDNALCTPHLGYVEWDSYELLFSQAFASVIAYGSGQPTGVVNPEVLA